MLRNLLGSLFGGSKGPDHDKPGEATRGALVLYRLGERAEAEAAAARQLVADPADIEALQVQAALALDAGEPRRALPVLQQLTARAPDDPALWVLLGRAQDASSQGGSAKQSFARAMALDPDDASLLVEQALNALSIGKPDLAGDLLERVDGTGHRLAEAHFRLAEKLRPRDPMLAMHHFNAAIGADDAHARAHAHLGALLREQGHAKAAEGHLAHAVALDKNIPEAAYNLALMRIDQRAWGDAAALLQQYSVARPRDADAHYWRANALMGFGDAAAARRAYADAVRCDAGHAAARWGMAMAHLPPIPATLQEEADAPSQFAKALDTLQAWARTHAGPQTARAVGAQQPFYLAYIAKDHRDLLAKYGALSVAQMATWARKVGVPTPAAVHAGRLRVGIVSAHIHSHSVWHALIKGWLQHLDPSRFELHVFHTGRQRDAETEWAARHAKLHENLGDWPAYAKALSDTRFDVLLYPEIGMDATTMRLAALRLARKQVAGWGHPVTSGLPTMDAYLSAEAFEPVGAAGHYTEELVPLPRLGCAYQPYGTPPQAPDPAQWNILPADRLLVCPGVPFKYRPADDVLLVDIARRCRPCKLVFFRARGDAHADRLEQRLRTAFDAAGVPYEDSVRFIPWQPQAAFFGLLQRAHVCLDTTGFSGFNTVMQAVECGTPVVAWEGAFMRGRFAAAVLRQMDLGAWVASTHADYADKVQQLCESAALRETVRGQLRERSGRLYDDRASVAALAAHLERLAAA